MPKYKIFAGLGGGFGGARYESTEEFDNEEQAEQYAWECAVQTFESYSGLHGLQTVEDIMEEEVCSLEEAEGYYQEQIESWIDYRVKLDDGEPEE